MQSRRARLDCFIAQHDNLSLRQVRLMIAQGQVQLDGERASQINQVVGQFTRVTVNERVLQDCSARYVMLHKPQGVVSATRDERHRTVLDLLPQPYAYSLHRCAVGGLNLDPALAAGESRELGPADLASLGIPHSQGK